MQGVPLPQTWELQRQKMQCIGRILESIQDNEDTTDMGMDWDAGGEMSGEVQAGRAVNWICRLWNAAREGIRASS